MRNSIAVSSAARTTSGAGQAVATDSTRIAVLVNVTAVSGTSPSLALRLEWSADGTTWVAADPADTFAAITATGGVSKVFDAKAQYLRLAWTITGTTPSFTFSASVWG